MDKGTNSDLLKNLDKIQYLNEIDELGLKDDEYIIFASAACILYGYPDVNRDIDVWVRNDALYRIRSLLVPGPKDGTHNDMFTNAKGHLDISGEDDGFKWDIWYPKTIVIGRYRFLTVEGVREMYHALYYKRHKPKHLEKIKWFQINYPILVNGKFDISKKFNLNENDITNLNELVKSKYKEVYGYDVSYMRIKFTDISVFNDGRPDTKTKPTDSAGNWTMLGYIAINRNYKEVMKKWTVSASDTEFMFQIVAHELAHEIYLNVLDNKDREKIYSLVEKENFSTNYTRYLKEKNKVSVDKYREECCCEYLSYRLKDKVFLSAK